MGFKKIIGNIKDKYDNYSDQRKRENIRKEKIAQEGKEKYQKYETAVNRLLDKFEIPDLDQFLTRIIGKKPESGYETDEYTGRKQKTTPSRREYLDFVWTHLNDNEINFQQLKDFAQKERIVTPSFFGDETDLEIEKKEFDELINAIKASFEPEKITDEEHLQSQLTIFLKAKFSGRKVAREVQTKLGDKLDIVVDNKYVFELKVPTDRTTLRNLSAQLEEYVQEFPNVCAVIFDNEELNLSSDINDYVDKYKCDYGIRTIILRGSKRL